MSGHEQYGEDLALLALGSLEGVPRAELEKHLDTCSSCRRELERLRGDMALVAIAAGGPRPPLRSRQRLLEAIAKEPRGVSSSAPPAKGFQWWAVLAWAAAAAMLLVVLQLRQANRALRESVASLGSMVGQQTIELENARRVMDALTGEDAQKVILVAKKTPLQPQGKAFYLRRKNGLVFLASNLAPLPPEKIYELWLFPTSGGPPIAAGLFKPDAHGSATVVNPPLPAGVEAKAFAVTLEPVSGSHETPRGTGVMQGE
jgi:anti-sigma-K factor RskA